MRLLAALIVVLALAGCSQTGQGPPRITIQPPTQTTPTQPAPPPIPRVKPVSVDVPTINAHSTLVPLGLKPDGSLDTPDVHHPQQAGYFCVTDPIKVCANGVVPGQPGPAVIVGHVDGAHQQGVFFHLRNMKVGDTATVTEDGGRTLTFTAYRVLQAAKTQFPSSVVYGDTVGPELRLITCTGQFVGGSLGYADNMIVFMSLVPNPPGT